MGDLNVYGGAGGMDARLDDLDLHAKQIDDCADRVWHIARQVGAIGASIDLAQAAALCPVEVAAVEASVAKAAGGGLTPDALTMDVFAHCVKASAVTYRAADLAHERIMHAITMGMGISAGSFVFTPPGALFAGSVAFLAWQKPDEFSRIVYENPWLMDETATILPWALQSATFTVASLTPFGRPGVIALTEGHWPATTYREAVEGTLAMLENAGAVSGDGSFHLGDPYVRQDTPDRLYADNALQTLMGAHDMDDEAAPEDPYAQIQIMDVLDDHGQIVGHVVQIPGTEDWSTHRTVNPSDAYGCLTAAAQRQTMMQDMAEEAMRKHGVTGDVPVMITGHSQGGMNAAALASDPDFVGRYNVTNLLTGGSPTGRFDIDPRVQALLIENTPDPVPYLDAADNPDRDNMTTVQYDLPPVDATPNPVEAHRLSSYEEVARLADQSHHPSIDRWREQAGPLLDGTGLRTTTYKILPDEPPLPIEPSHGRSGTVLGHPASPPAEPGYGYGSPYDKR